MADSDKEIIDDEDEEEEPPQKPNIISVKGMPVSGKSPYPGGKGIAMKGMYPGGKGLPPPSKPKQKRTRDPTEVSLELLAKKTDELAKIQKRAATAVSKDYSMKKWKIDILTKALTDLNVRMMRVMREKVAGSTRIMTKHRMGKYNTSVVCVV